MAAVLDPEISALLVKKAWQAKEPSLNVLPIGLNDPLQVKVRFSGDKQSLVQTGFNIAYIAGPVAYGTATLDVIEKLAADPHVQQIEKQRTRHTTLNDSIPDIHANEVWSRNNDNFTGYNGKDVIVGIIDTGIDFTHQVFRKPGGGSRILKIWDQTLTAQGGETVPGAITRASIALTPTPLGYGVVYETADIDNAINNTHTGAGIQARHRDQDGHGTHVAGIAAGDGSQSGGCHGSYTYIGVAPAADIMMVRLWGLTEGDKGGTEDHPAPIPSPTTGNSLIVDAIRFLLNEAANAGKPIAINLSLGFFSDIMDGTGGDCDAVDHLLTNNSTGTAIVFAAGNDGDQAFHASGTVPAGPTNVETIKFRIASGDTKPRYLSIRYTGSNLSVQVTSPVSGSNGVIPWLASGAAAVTNTTANGSGPNASVIVQNSTNYISIAITPTNDGATPPKYGENSSGDWKIELKDSGSTATAYHAFCLYGSSHDQRSPFFLNHVNTDNTLDTDSCCKECITVGAYHTGGSLAGFSGRGPTMDTPARTKPEICAPGVDISSAGIPSDYGGCHLCCCDCCHDFYVSKGGTSMAAPHVTGAIALMLHKNPTLTHSQIKQKLIDNHGPSDPNPPPASVVNGWGAGKLQVKSVMDAIPQVNPPVTASAMQPQHLIGLRESFMQLPRANELAELAEKYGAELVSLINKNKRVATVWHRCRGPVWTRFALRAASQPSEPLPAMAYGVTLNEAITRMLSILKEYGSTAFRTDLSRFEPELLALPESLSLVEMMQQLGHSQKSAYTVPL